MNHWTPNYGLPYPMGCSWDVVNNGYNFTLLSKTATSVSLLFFKTSAPGVVIFRYDLDPVTNKIGSIWSCFLTEAQLPGADSYAYRVDGPVAPGNHFDPGKVLLDPWSSAIFFPPAFSRAAACLPGDNTGKAPLTLLPRPKGGADILAADVQPVHYHDLVIYELHVRGFTVDGSSGVPAAHQGTFSGIVDKIPYLLELGITAVELMPVHQFDPQENNYWGYMTLNFFSPHQGYGTDPSSKTVVDEFKQMVLALHQAGIEVILDVIFNHTTEGDDAGPTYSYKGIDNSAYYLMTPDLAYYLNDSGAGNVMRTSYKLVRKLVLDSLRYWVQEMHVDGFRFDLATIFTRNDDGSVNTTNPPILEEIFMDPVLSGVRLIAEPWDIDSYQLGTQFPGTNWSQWNGKFRDDIRQFVKGDNGKVGALMSRVYGSTDLFPPEIPYSAKPYQSINFINSHDGFNLYDLVAYNDKHNLANGYNNADGSNDNYSWNCGWEGDLNLPPDILSLRQQQAKNFMVLLFFSNGIPMFRMGDEFLHTQGGNNNPFNQDNATSWLNWNRKSQFADFFRFVKLLIGLRKAHPSIGRGFFWSNDLRWYGVGGQPDLSYTSHSVAWYLDGRSMGDSDFYVMINSWWQPLEFPIQEGVAGQWTRIIDTSLHSPDDMADSTAPAATQALQQLQYIVNARSVVVLKRG
jgi:glycogen operon protein